MKLKGSATIEAAVLVPLFMIMLVNIILLALDCHDSVIINCASDKICMEAEFYSYDTELYKRKINELEVLVNKYIEEKTVNSKAQIDVKDGVFDVSTEYSETLKNNPVDFVWLTDAAKKLINEED